MLANTLIELEEFDASLHSHAIGRNPPGSGVAAIDPYGTKTVGNRLPTLKATQVSTPDHFAW